MSSRVPDAANGSSLSLRHATVSSFDGAAIHYDVHSIGAASLVIVVPGFWRSRRHPSMIRFARLLNDCGYDAAVVDIRGHGDSGGTYGFNQHEHHDVAAVAGELIKDYRSFLLAGFSYGAAISITTATRHELPIDAVLLVSAVADFSMIAPKLNLLRMHRHIAFSQALKKPKFIWRLRRESLIRAVDEIGSIHVPVCLIHVKDDWLIGHRHSVALYEAANEPKELHLLDIPGNYHADRIFSIAPQLVEPIVRDFLERNVRK